MKVYELRIGNLFECMGMVQTVFEICDNTDRGRVNQAGYEHIIRCIENNNQYKPIEIHPIPLTEDWLKRFALKRGYDERILSFDIDDFYTIVYNNKDEWHDKAGWYLYVNSTEYETSTVVQYVHELQNLFFVLKGIECAILNDKANG